MECEKNTWYIEISDTEWTEYTGDTSDLWHIRNRFDVFADVLDTLAKVVCRYTVLKDHRPCIRRMQGRLLL